MAPVELSPLEPDLSAFVRPGDGIVWGQACAEPTVLVDACLRLAAAVPRLSAFVGLSWRDLSGAIPDGLRIVSYGALGRLGQIPSLEVVPSHFSALPQLFAARLLPGNVALIQVAPPDANGQCSLGVGVDYLADALDHARVVVAEVNDHCPASAGVSVAWDRLDAVVRSSRPLLAAPPATPGEFDTAIAQRVAEIVQDGDTVQLGVGSLPEAILRALADHRGLGVHSGMVSDGVLDLIERGAVTNEHKPRDRGLTVAGAALGSERLFTALAERHEIRLRPVSYTHDQRILAEVGPLVAINSAVEVDLVGQVNSERAAGRRVGAVGGQVDFLRAATSAGGRAIIALPSGRIVRRLGGSVSTSRSDVDWIVTECGSCSLRGLSDERRRRELLRVAGEARGELLASGAGGI